MTWPACSSSPSEPAPRNMACSCSPVRCNCFDTFRKLKPSSSTFSTFKLRCYQYRMLPSLATTMSCLSGLLQMSSHFCSTAFSSVQPRTFFQCAWNDSLSINSRPWTFRSILRRYASMVANRNVSGGICSTIFPFSSAQCDLKSAYFSERGSAAHAS